MGAFILAALVALGSLAASIFVAFAESMATAPVYDKAPMYILVVGCVIAALIATSHWLPPVGW